MNDPITILYKTVITTYPEYEPPKAIIADGNWVRSVEGNGVCPLCLRINRGLFPRPIDVVLNTHPRQGQPCADIEGMTIRIWHRQFLSRIQDHLDDFSLGHCWFQDGTELADYATCYSRQWIVVRGNRYSSYDICSGCGAISSRSTPGPEYILRRYLSSNKVYQDSGGMLYFTPEIAERFKFRGWSYEELHEAEDYLFLEPVSVRSKPADDQTLPGDSDPCTM